MAGVDHHPPRPPQEDVEKLHQPSSFPSSSIASAPKPQTNPFNQQPIMASSAMAACQHQDKHQTISTNHHRKPSMDLQTSQTHLSEKSSAQTQWTFIGSHKVPFNQCSTPDEKVARPSVVGLKLSHFASTSSRNPLIFQDKPKVVFQKSDKAKLLAGMKHVLIAKFSHGHPSVLMLQKFLSNRKLLGIFHVSLFDTKHMLIEFESFVDFAKFWIKQKGFIHGYPVRFFKWDEHFDPSKESSIIPVWIHLPRLPLYLFEEGAILLIASALGRPLHIDVNNLNRKNIGYATVCIEFDILKAPPRDILIQFGEDAYGGKPAGSCDSFLQKVVYGFMPTFCSYCSHIGHRSMDCKRVSSGFQKTPATDMEDAVCKVRGASSFLGATVNVLTPAVEVCLSEGENFSVEEVLGVTAATGGTASVNDVAAKGNAAEGDLEWQKSSGIKQLTAVKSFDRDAALKGINQLKGMLAKPFFQAANVETEPSAAAGQSAAAAASVHAVRESVLLGEPVAGMLGVGQAGAGEMVFLGSPDKTQETAAETLSTAADDPTAENHGFFRDIAGVPCSFVEQELLRVPNGSQIAGEADNLNDAAGVSSACTQAECFNFEQQILMEHFSSDPVLEGLLQNAQFTDTAVLEEQMQGDVIWSAGDAETNGTKEKAARNQQGNLPEKETEPTRTRNKFAVVDEVVHIEDLTMEEGEIADGGTVLQDACQFAKSVDLGLNEAKCAGKSITEYAGAGNPAVSLSKELQQGNPHECLWPSKQQVEELTERMNRLRGKEPDRREEVVFSGNNSNNQADLALHLQQIGMNSRSVKHVVLQTHTMAADVKEVGSEEQEKREQAALVLLETKGVWSALEETAIDDFQMFMASPKRIGPVFARTICSEVVRNSPKIADVRKHFKFLSNKEQTTSLVEQGKLDDMLKDAMNEYTKEIYQALLEQDKSIYPENSTTEKVTPQTQEAILKVSTMDEKEWSTPKRRGRNRTRTNNI